MSKEFRPIGWANTIMSLKEAWDSVMTIEGSALRKLDPRVAHMVFQVLAFMWSGIFAVLVGSTMAFGISAVFHIALITGVFVTAVTLNAADKNPTKVNNFFQFRKGYHTYGRQRGYVVYHDDQGNPHKVQLDPKDPGGEHV